jgi:DNA (cytosine-5)-methyltransferase 1
MVNFKECLTVKDASHFLGVTIMTLHRWDAAGKLKALRHPINNYRLYKKSDLEKLLKGLNKPSKKTT